MSATRTRTRLAFAILAIAATSGLGLFTAARPVGAQQVLRIPESTIEISRGMSALLTRPNRLERVSIADPDIAEAVVISPLEIIVNARGVGTTSLLMWEEGQPVRLLSIEVTADIAGLERQLGELFPDAGLSLASQGSTVILSGIARDPSIVRRALEIIEATGLTVINNVTAPWPQQIKLKVRFAEVDRSVTKSFGNQFRATNPQRLGDGLDDENDEYLLETMSEGLISFGIFGDLIGGPGSTSFTSLEGFLVALKATGRFKSLAEPNLVALEGEEASFLAGGEFPYPVIQPGGNSNAVTVVFREFGIRLTFRPTVTNNGTIRLEVSPEVSSLDFANGLTLSGFAIPSLLTRRVTTQVELSPGQHLAIGGLMDNSVLESVDKIPLLGDIPILGHFFKSSSLRERKTELLVLVTPELVTPSDVPLMLPGGEPGTWGRSDFLEADSTMTPAAGLPTTSGATSTTGRTGGNGGR